KLALSARSAGTALAIRKIAIATMTTSTTAPEAVVNQRNRLSRPNRRRDGSPPPPPRGPVGPRSVGAASPAVTGAVSAGPAIGDWLKDFWYRAGQARDGSGDLVAFLGGARWV